jgi:predicted nuclease with TOPRIM domain
MVTDEELRRGWKIEELIDSLAERKLNLEDEAEMLESIYIIGNDKGIKERIDKISSKIARIDKRLDELNDEWWDCQDEPEGA